MNPEPNYFKMWMEKGTLFFEHIDDNPEEKRRGIASFNLNTRVSIVNGEKKKSLAGYFRCYSVGSVGKPNSFYYMDERKSIRNEISQLGDYGKFLLEQIIPNFYQLTDYNYKNLGNILEYVHKFENMYNWRQEGFKIRFITDSKLSVLPKSHRNILKMNNITIGQDMLNIALEDPEYIKHLIVLLNEEKIPSRNNHNGWEVLLNSRDLHNLIKEEKYDLRATIRYMYNYIIPYEGLIVREIIRYLRDYSSMHSQMDVTDFKKFPKYLVSMHDIIKTEFNNFKKEIDDKKFKEMIRDELEFESKKEGFIIKVPKCSDDLKNEGKQLSHCVGSYIQRIIRGETQILFLRSKSNPKKSLITLEVRDDVLIQAKGLSNRGITKEEKKKIEKFAKEKNLLVRI